MKVPARRRGNGSIAPGETITVGLNESPRPKAGKCFYRLYQGFHSVASMKVPARRRGNQIIHLVLLHRQPGLNESPRPKAGKWGSPRCLFPPSICLNESPRPKAGKSGNLLQRFLGLRPQ